MIIIDIDIQFNSYTVSDKVKDCTSLTVVLFFSLGVGA